MTGPMVLAVIAASAIVIHFVCVCDKMDRTTYHVIRVVYGVIGMAALAVALGPLYGSSPTWADALAIMGVALFMVFDRRRTSGSKDETDLERDRFREDSKKLRL